MLGIVKDVDILSSYRAESKAYGKINNRKSHAFLFKIGGAAEYDFGGVRTILKADQVLFVPEGASYEYTASSRGLYTSINFSADVEHPVPRVCSVGDFYKIDYIYNRFSELWRFGSLPDKYACFSVFYDFLSYFTRAAHSNDQEKNKAIIIEPAVGYLKSHLFDCNLKVENLSKLCCISDTYFRKLFVLRFGVSPQEYVISRRISHAKALIESGDFDSISEVAEFVGYRDPLYFSKAFKKIYGISPSKINR